MSKLTGLLFILTGIGIASYAIPSDTSPTGAATKQLDAAEVAPPSAITKSVLALKNQDFVSTALAQPPSDKRRRHAQPDLPVSKALRPNGEPTPVADKLRPRSFSSSQPVLLEPPVKVTRPVKVTSKDIKARIKTIVAERSRHSTPAPKNARPAGQAASARHDAGPAETSGRAASRFIATFPAGIARFIAALSGGRPSGDDPKAGSTTAVMVAKKPALPTGPRVVRTVSPKLISATLTTVADVAGSDQQRFAATKPADDLERAKLARDLQTELRRIGCYSGAIDGNWGRGSRSAMRAFTEAVSATLPVDKPDYILLTLVQGHVSKACGRSCAAGSTLSQNGTCITPTILAATKPVPRKVTKLWRATQPKSPPKLVTRNWSTSTKVAAKKRTVTPKRTAQRRVAVEQTFKQPQKTRRLIPLPGRMAIRGPTRLQPRRATRKARVIAKSKSSSGNKAKAAPARRVAGETPRRASRFSADRPLVTVRRKAKPVAATTARPRRAAIKMPGPMIRTPSIVPLSRTAASRKVASRTLASRTAATRLAKQRTLSTSQGPVIDVPRPKIAASRPTINSPGSAQNGITNETANSRQNPQARGSVEPKPAKATRRRRSRRARARPRPRRYRPTYSLGAKKRRSRPRRVRRARARSDWKRRAFNTADGA